MVNESVQTSSDLEFTYCEDGQFTKDIGPVIDIYCHTKKIKIKLDKYG